jgi:NAD dependent epimerase/dehydratase
MKLAGKRVTVTGADGFIGSHLIEALLSHGAQVRAFCYYNSFDSRGWLDTLPEDVTGEIDFFMGDVRDPNGVRLALTDADACFHLAALIGIPFSYRSPDSYIDTNVRGTLNVLQSARDLRLERVIVTSTSEVYGTARYVPIDELHPLQGQSPYSASKIAADKLAESFYRSFDVPVITARPFNTYGPRQSARAIIPTILTQLWAGATELSLGSLHPTRDLNYVTDTCAGFISLAECDEAVGREVNIGSGVEISIGDLAGKLMKIVGTTVPIATQDERVRPPKSEVERLLADTTLIRELTAWESTVSLDDGLRRTSEWFHARDDGRRGWDRYSV